MNQTEGKTTAELLALTQVLGEMVANGIVTRIDHADGVHYYLFMGSHTYEVSLDVTVS